MNKIESSRNRKLSFLLYTEGARYLRITIFVIFIALLCLISFVTGQRNILTLTSGQVCPENIIAKTRIVDYELTESLRENAANTTSPVFDYISAAQTDALMDLAELKNLSFQSHIGSDFSIDNVNLACSTNLTESDFLKIYELNSKRKNEYFAFIEQAVNTLYSSGIKSTELDSVEAKAVSYLMDEIKDEELLKIASSIIKSICSPNMLLNESATKIAKDAAREAVYEVTYESGQTIVNKGEILTDHDISLLSANGLINSDSTENIKNNVMRWLMFVVITSLIGIYLKRYHEDIFYDNQKMFIFFSILLIMITLSIYSYSYSLYMIPSVALTICIAILFSSRVATQILIFMVMYLGSILDLSFGSLFYILFSGYVGITISSLYLKRVDIIKNTLICSIANSICVFFLNYRTNVSISQMLPDIVYTIVGAVFSAIVSTVLIMVYEELFNLATPFRLTELNGGNDHLIKELINKAPGTYYHSLMVGSLAENACIAINANALLARVGALYHDIGKTDKPFYYKENQREGENAHDLIAPEISAKIIKNHVSDGIYLAKKNRLPKEIIDFIETHHGTSELTYFKEMAKLEKYNGNEDFHYQGNIPKTKECSIVMLADSIEATSRTLEVHTDETLMRVINGIIDKKIAEGQLVDSKLTFEELQMIKDSFLSSLKNIYHSRIKYPGQL